MADTGSYPQIPSNVWWGLRALLRRRPTIKIDEMLLASDLEVQLVAARQYLKELKRSGLLDEDGRPTEVASKWRNDETYQEAVEALLSEIYPESLRLSAPPGDTSRAKVVNWFTLQGLGTGAAGNKAATYLLISSPEPLELGPPVGNQKAKVATRADKGSTEVKQEAKKPSDKANSKSDRRDISMPLNINVQVHISADASNEQIESIFKSMRRYLYDDQAS